MKELAVGIALSVLANCAFALKSTSKDVHFGPQNCVMLSRSSEGSCVLSTDCAGADISQTEFAFDCIGQNNNRDVVRHSFGVGGFEASEEFDTEVKCGRCASASQGEATPAPPAVKKVEAPLPPAPEAAHTIARIVRKSAGRMAHAVSAKPKVQPKTKSHAQEAAAPVSFKAKTATKTEAKAKAKAGMWPFSSSESSPAAVKYGPNGCVSVYKSSEDHCIMKTSCKGNDISNYEFGLVCVDKAGSPVKHLFGKDSFDSEETFDTLIKCDQCLGLEDLPDTIALSGEVASMVKDISNLKAVMRNISVNVQMLNEKVFPAPPAAPGPAPAPAAAAESPAAAEEPKKVAFHSSANHHRHHGHLRHSHKRHHHRRDYDDDEDEDEDEDDDEREAPPSPLVAAAPHQYEPSVVAKGVAQLGSLARGEIAVPVQHSTSAEEDDDDDGDDDGNEYD